LFRLSRSAAAFAAYSPSKVARALWAERYDRGSLDAIEQASQMTGDRDGSS
jgi:hypothetical protein